MFKNFHFANVAPIFCFLFSTHIWWCQLCSFHSGFQIITMIFLFFESEIITIEFRANWKGEINTISLCNMLRCSVFLSDKVGRVETPGTASISVHWGSSIRDYRSSSKAAGATGRRCWVGWIRVVGRRCYVGSHLIPTRAKVFCCALTGCNSFPLFDVFIWCKHLS